MLIISLHMSLHQWLLKGTMTMGEAGKNGVRTSDLKECQEILDIFFSHGHKELDTARMYAEGTTEPVRMDLWSTELHSLSRSM